MTSSKKHYDIESGDRAQQLQHDVSGSAKKKRQSIDWKTYTHSGTKAAYAWLVILFLCLGLSVQQASLSTIFVESMTTRSTVENVSFASPDLEVVEETVGNLLPSVFLEAGEETNRNPKNR